MSPLRGIAAAALLAAAAIAAGCGGEVPPAPPPGAIAAGTPIGGARITGSALFRGAVPPPETLSVSSDPVCQAKGAGQLRQDVVVNADATLQNVFVRVVSGLENRVFAPPATPVVLDQRGCVFRPHVLGIQVNQYLEIVNDDATLHNVHPMSEVNKPFNVGMPLEGMRVRKFFGAPETMIRVKCDLHNWMLAWVGVVEHPFFAVTGEKGSYAIEGLPAGRYEIEAWHEKFGTKKASIELGDGETKEASFDFTP